MFFLLKNEVSYFNCCLSKGQNMNSLLYVKYSFYFCEISGKPRRVDILLYLCAYQTLTGEEISSDFPQVFIPSLPVALNAADTRHLSHLYKNKEC